MRAALTLLLAATAALAEEPLFPSSMPATPVALLPDLRADLAYGNWNARIHAVEKLGAMGTPAARRAFRRHVREEARRNIEGG